MKLRQGVFALGLLGLIMPAAAQDVPRAKAVIELFTSQGCSSCPPADALLVELSREPGVVALTFNVDIWDYLGWRDTLAKPQFTQRQRAYGKAMGERQIYTPQAVVNGSVHVVGSNFGAVTRARQATLKGENVLAVPVSITRQAGGWRVQIDAADLKGRTGAVTLLPIDRERVVPIGRGENSGRSVTYANVVRDITILGAFEGQKREFVVTDDRLREVGANGLAVLVQATVEGRPGTVLGAAISSETKLKAEAR